jgi:hypothetical protein
MCQRGQVIALTPTRRSDHHGLGKCTVGAVEQQATLMWVMPMSPAAAEIDPVSRMLSSKLALPGSIRARIENDAHPEPCHSCARAAVNYARFSVLRLPPDHSPGFKSRIMLKSAQPKMAHLGLR